MSRSCGLNIRHTALLFQTGNEAFDGLGEIIERCRIRLAARRDEGRFIDQIGEISAGETGRQSSDGVDVELGTYGNLLQMHAQDVGSPFAVGTIDQHLPVKTAGAQQRGIENLRSVRRGEHDNAHTRIEPIHFRKQLIERLFLLVMPAAWKINAARASQRVEFVDEYDRRRAFPRLPEKIADARSADTDEHFDEFRAGNREEWNVGLSGDGARQQRLAGTGRPDEQQALGHARTEPAIVTGILEEAHDLREFLLRLVDTGHVCECHIEVALCKDLGAAAPDPHQPAQIHAGPAKKKHPPAEDQEHRQYP